MRKIMFAGALIYASLVLFTGLDPVRGALAMATAIACCYPMWRYLHYHDRGIPFVPAMAVMYSLYFALPVLAPVPAYPRFQGLPDAALTEASLLAFVGILALLFGYYSLQARIWPSIIPTCPEVAWSDIRARRAGLVFGLLGMASYTYEHIAVVPLSVAQGVTLAAQLALLSAALLLYLFLQRKLPRRYVLFLWAILVPTIVLLDVSSGYLYFAFRDIFVLTMIYLLVRRRIPWATLLLSLLIGIILLSFKTEYRQASWTGQNAIGQRQTSGNPVSNLTTYAGVIQGDSSQLTSTTYLSQTGQNVVNRLDNRTLLAQVVYLTPNTVPYWHGETYLWFVSKFIPRAIWPSKPEEMAGQTFGHRYFILDSNDSVTSVNMPQIVEAYANFGTIGVIVIMFMIGGLYRLLRYMFESTGSEWGKISAVFVYSSLLGIDSNFSLIFGNVMWWIVFLFLVGRLVSGKSLADSAAPRPRRRQRLNAVASGLGDRRGVRTLAPGSLEGHQPQKRDGGVHNAPPPASVVGGLGRG